MTNMLPMWLLYAGLAGTFFALIVATAQQNWNCRVFFLLALRFAIGWQFLFEGMHKINSHLVGPSETNRPFTSEPYFKASPTKAGDMMRRKFDDPGAVIAARVIPAKTMTPAEFAKLTPKEQADACPEAVRKEFDDLLEATETWVQAEAATDKKDAKKAQDKEIKDFEDAQIVATTANEQDLKDRIAAEQIEEWRKLAEQGDAAKRTEIQKEADTRKKALMTAFEAKQSKAKLAEELEKVKSKAKADLAKKEKAADEKAGNFKAIAAERVENAKIAYAAWVYGAEGRESKVKFTTGDAALTAPQRLAHLEWLKNEAQAAQDRVGSGIGNGNGVEMKHAAELRTELQTAEADLARDAWALDIKKALTGKDYEIPKADSEGKRLDKFTTWFIAIVGACILFGFLTRFSCMLAAGFLVITYLTHPAVPWYPLPPGTEGNPLFINKNAIECLALGVLACYPTGRWLGTDALISRFIFGKTEETATPA